MAGKAGKRVSRQEIVPRVRLGEVKRVVAVVKTGNPGTTQIMSSDGKLTVGVGAGPTINSLADYIRRLAQHKEGTVTLLEPLEGFSEGKHDFSEF